MTLLQWIETDDGDTTTSTLPALSEREQAFHAQIVVAPGDWRDGREEALQPPPGLHLAPLG